MQGLIVAKSINQPPVNGCGVIEHSLSARGSKPTAERKREREREKEGGCLEALPVLFP